jgi:hypothetical protein
VVENPSVTIAWPYNRAIHYMESIGLTHVPCREAMKGFAKQPSKPRNWGLHFAFCSLQFAWRGGCWSAYYQIGALGKWPAADQP